MELVLYTGKKIDYSLDKPIISKYSTQQLVQRIKGLKLNLRLTALECILTLGNGFAVTKESSTSKESDVLLSALIAVSMDEQDRMSSKMYSFSIVGTEFEYELGYPDFIRKAELYKKYWPLLNPSYQLSKIRKQIHIAQRKYRSPPTIDTLGTSHWFQILSGELTLCIYEPSDTNFLKLDALKETGNVEQFFNQCTPTQTEDLEAGDFFYIPFGWIYNIYIVEDAVLYSGQFHHTLTLGKEFESLGTGCISLYLDSSRLAYEVELLFWFTAMSIMNKHLCSKENEDIKELSLLSINSKKRAREEDARYLTIHLNKWIKAYKSHTLRRPLGLDCFLMSKDFNIYCHARYKRRKTSNGQPSVIKFESESF